MFYRSSPGGWLAMLMALHVGLCIPSSTYSQQGVAPRRVPQLLVTLPDDCPTPDGMAIDPAGNLIVACPNFADPSQPACLIRITPQLQVSKWIDVPSLKQTGRACPMGIAFGPDGALFVCDNQNWATGNGEQGETNQGRILRLRIDNGQLVETTVVASGISHPNGIRVHENRLYVTVSMLPKIKRPDGLLVSGIYRFDIQDENVRVTNTPSDENLLATLVTENRDCQYGADGLAFDSQGHLFVGNFGDGALHKISFDANGQVAHAEVFAKTDFQVPMTAEDFSTRMVKAAMRTTDGICIDAHDNIYVADFSNNAICRVDPRGKIMVLAQSPDGDGSDGGLDQPGEPILWQGKLVVTCFDVVTGPDKVNTQHDKPFTISYIDLRTVTHAVIPAGP
ncbi:MAG: SMP-30/gluconolactonase/LRE family protein [Pirellulaceae bacterium]